MKLKVQNRVTIDASGLQPISGCTPTGIARTTRELINSLLKLQDLPFQLTLYTQRLIGKRLASHDFPVSINHLPLPRQKIVSWITQRIPIIERMCQCDLFHAPANWAPVSRLSRCVVTIHDALFFAYPEENLGHQVERARIPPLARSSAAIITCSHVSKIDIVRYMKVDPAKVYVIPWGVRQEVFYPVVDTKTATNYLASKYGLTNPYFLSVSCSTGRKNTFRIVNCFLEIASKYSGIQLALVWRNPPEIVLNKVKASNYRDRVRFITEVDDADLRLLYGASIGVIFVSYYEGFGLPVLEAMACGAPVISSNTSSMPEVGGDSVLYVGPEQDAEIVNSMCSLLKYPDLRFQLIQKGSKRASQFNWMTCARETSNVYKEMLSGIIYPKNRTAILPFQSFPGLYDVSQ